MTDPRTRAEVLRELHPMTEHWYKSRIRTTARQLWELPQKLLELPFKVIKDAADSIVDAFNWNRLR